jgi:hypothetical protein
LFELKWIELPEKVRSSIRKLTDDPDLRYEIPSFTKSETLEFMKRYSAMPAEKIDSFVQSIYNQTKGQPLEVKLALDITKEDQYNTKNIVPYLQHPMNFQTMLVCLLLAIANLSITDTLLKSMGLLKYDDLDRIVLFREPDGSWRTIH